MRTIFGVRAMPTLGDTIDMMFYVNETAKRNGLPAKIVTRGYPHKEWVKIKSIFNLDYINTFESGAAQFADNTVWMNGYPTEEMNKFWRSIDKFPLITLKSKNYPEPSEKFIVSQWDAGQPYRILPPERIENISNWYKNKGYSQIIVGKQAENPKLFHDLEYVAYLIQKADYYVGSDSGFMHMAKFLKEPDKIHIYNYTEPRQDIVDSKGRTNSAQFILCMEKGIKRNYCEEIDE